MPTASVLTRLTCCIHPCWQVVTDLQCNARSWSLVNCFQTVPTTTKYGNVFYLLSEVHVIMILEAPLAAERRNCEERGKLIRDRPAGGQLH